MSARHLASLSLAVFLAAAAPAALAQPTIVERSAVDLSADLAAGRATSEALVRAYLDRIEAVDQSRPQPCTASSP